MNRRRFFSVAGSAVLDSSPNDTQTRGFENEIQRALSEREGSLKGLPEPIQFPRRTSAGLEVYLPRPEKPWDKQRASYLLKRTMFGAKKADVEMALTKTPGEVVDMLLADTALPNPPGSWVNDNYSYDSPNDTRNNGYFSELRQWWIELMVNQDFSIREKMTLFWHDHWATEYLTVRQPHFNYWFLDSFRNNFLGNFRQMVKDVAISPCMLVYLDGRYNIKGRPNENYAREQMELHTLGEGNGYTEDDIQQAARALTGWTLQELSPGVFHPKDALFVSTRFDNTDKTFMGQTGNWNHSDIVDIIFAQRQQEVAKYICRKLYREFVYEIADESIISDMTTILVSNNWEIKPVLTTLLKSEHFFETANIGAHITSPIECYIGALRMLEIQPASSSVYTEIFNICKNQGLEILQPPNVKGWPGYRSWISASRLASRWSSTDELVNDSKTGGGKKYPFDPVAFISKISTPNDANAITDDVISLLFDVKISDYQRDVLLEKFLSGWKDYEWDINNPGAPDRLRGLFKAALRNNEAELI